MMGGLLDEVLRQQFGIIVPRFQKFWTRVVCWGDPDPDPRAVKSRARALKAWEFFLFLAWLGQALSLMLLLSFLKFDPHFEARIMFPPDFYTHPVVLVGAVLLIVVGTGVKIYVVYLSGMNNYYYYDMMLQCPNAAYVDSGLYKISSHPT